MEAVAQLARWHQKNVGKHRQTAEVEALEYMELQQGHRAAGAVGNAEATTKCSPQAA